jgi:hypothetical protein
VTVTLKSLARRIPDLGDEIADLDPLIAPLVAELARGLLALPDVGVANATELLVTAGQNPNACVPRPGLPCSAAPARSRP